MTARHAVRSWRWRTARLLNRLPGTCWADLVSWALGSTRWPWAPVTTACRVDAAACGRCYCGQIGADGKAYRESAGGAVVTPAERLRTAAERWERLDRSATTGPWQTGASWAGKCAVLTAEGLPIAVVSQGEPGLVAGADADLIAALRPVPRWAAGWLRAQALRADRWLAYDTVEVRHFTPSCGLVFGGADDAWRCTCFDSPLALAAIVLGERP